MKKRGGHPLAARIKRLMQTDEDVGKIAQATPALIGAREIPGPGKLRGVAGARRRGGAC